MRSAYPATVRLAVIFTLSVPDTGVSPGAVLNVTAPVLRFTVKSVPSVLFTQLPLAFITWAVTAAESSPPKLSWNTVAVLCWLSTMKSSSHFGCNRFSPS